MLDPSEKGSEAEEMSSSSSKSQDGESLQQQQQKKTCADCGTTKTPLWRGGPAGPKSLCNACGIRSRKRRRDILGLNKGSSGNEKKVKKGHGNSGGSNGNNNKLGVVGLKQRLMALGRDVMMRRSPVEKQRKLGEEEQAAVLLMALSCGSVYA